MHKERIAIFLAVLSLVAIGIVMIYSTSAIYADEKFHDSYYFLKRQLTWLAIGLALFFAVSRFPYPELRKISLLILILSLAMLAAVFLPVVGKSAGGARRWLHFSFLTIQPSEFAKLAILVFLADFLARRQRKLGEFFRGFLPCLFILGVSMGLIVLQPDLGTVMLIGAVSFILFFVSGIRLSHLLTLFLLSLPVLYHFIFKVSYRRNRMLAFINPWKDPEGTGFQIIQSFIALGSGGLFGTGLGQSRQKLFYLPEAHTDFIFSIVGEELGLVGTTTVLGLFSILIILGVRISLKCQDLFGRLLSLGIVLLLGLQALINIGVVTGALPTKGLALPFISYGGSNLMVNLLMVGILLNVAKFAGKKSLMGHSVQIPADRTPRI